MSDPAVKKRRRKSFWLIMGILVLLFLLVTLLGVNNNLEVTHYEIRTEKIEGQIRVVQISDLHSNFYGEDQEELVAAIDEAKPDLVVITGDLFDHRVSHEGADALLRRLSGRYPLYYVTGNHAYYEGYSTYRDHMRVLEKYEVKRLQGDVDRLEIRGNVIQIAGVDDPYSEKIGNAEHLPVTGFANQLRQAAMKRDPETFCLLLSHRPDRISEYAAYGFDLVLAGHAHGGMIRIPFLNRGVISKSEGLFPEHTGGRVYEENGTFMVVSRGLARDLLFQPRLYNRPELVIIDIIGSE